MDCVWVLTTALVILANLSPIRGLGNGCLANTPWYSRNDIDENYKREFSVSFTPVQDIHISLGGRGQIRVTWMNPTIFKGGSFSPQCRYGVNQTNLNNSVHGIAYSYPDGHFSRTLNTAILNLTVFSNIYQPVYYQCGDKKYGWSSVYFFILQSHFAKPPESIFRSNIPDTDGLVASFEQLGAFDENPRIAFVADLGVIHGEHTIASILSRVKTGKVQLFVHAGDISYADKFGEKTHNNSYVWVKFMNELQPITTRVPYMVCPGNHETQFKFAAYINWLKMPTSESDSKSPFWYSFDYMGIHFLSFSTEHLFMRNSTQYHWMEKDLNRANQNRANIPWIVVFGHRPLYCSSLVCYERCEEEAPLYRSYLEDLLYQQKVDVYICGHNHQYERSYPVYKEKATQRNYITPKAPVYIVNGAAGNPELNDPTFKPGVSWRAFDEPTFGTGYTLLQPTANELRFQYILSKANKTVDSFTIFRV